jgi:transcription factor SPT20
MSGAVATARPTQALRVRRESQRPGVARVVTKTNNMEEESAKPEPKLYGMRHATTLPLCKNAQLTQRAVYTQEAILARHRGKLPSMRVYLYPNHFRINDSQESLTYASPMREILTALRDKKLPHNMLEELYANGTPFYEGCLIVEVHNYCNNTAKPKDSANSAGDGSKTAFSIHNNNSFITPSPYGVHPNNKPDPKANGTTAQAKEAGDKEDKENMPAPGTNGASQKQPASGPKIATVVLFPSTQAQLSDMSILATTPATDAATLKRMQAAGRGAGMPPTPLTAVPPTPTFSAGPSPKRQKMMIDDSNVHEFEAELLIATCPKLYLEPTKSFAESVALIDAMTHPNNKNSPPERKTRKRTTAELAADEADAQNLQSFMLAGDEQQATLNTTTAGGDDGAVRAAANTMSFARFKTLATIKANHEEQERRKKEEDARQAQAKRQAQMESEAQKRRDMEANRQQAEVQEQRQQLLARQQAQQQQMLQQNQMQQNEALRAAQAAQMSSAAAAQISQTPQSATQNQFSPSVRQNTPMAAAAPSPRIGGQASHPMGGTPMVATASNHAIASPARPPSSISHHPMARTASQQQGSMSRTNTPQMMQGTPVMNSAMPNRNMTPTPRMNQGSPSLQVQGATPILMQTPQSQNMTPEQMQALQQQQNQQRMQQIRLQQLQQSQQMNGMSPGGQNLQQMALQKAQMHVQAQGIPNGQNPHVFQQQLAQRYFQQLKQAQAAQAQQQNTQHAMNQMSPQGPQNGVPNQQAPNNMANMSVAQLRAHYQQRKQHLLQTFGQQVPQQHVQQMQQLEQLIRSKEQAQMQAQQQMGQNQMPMNQGMQGQMGGGQNPMQMQQYQQALLQQRAQQQRNDQLMRMRQQAMQQGGQMPQNMMNNMQGMNMGNMQGMNMGNMQGMNMQNMQGMQGMQGMNMGQMNQQQMQQMMMMRQAQQQQQQRLQQQGGDMNWSGV